MFIILSLNSFNISPSNMERYPAKTIKSTLFLVNSNILFEISLPYSSLETTYVGMFLFLALSSAYIPSLLPITISTLKEACP